MILLAQTDQATEVSGWEVVISIGILVFYVLVAVVSIVGLCWVIYDRLKARKTETFEKRDN
ncbi:MAG: hypothetical protein OXF85_00830 [Candidatus Saccharibacteria bacterium]|nr:hypothetical protein [Candidatus Saccharibacteria bacterium]MCY4010522.1 hypothetical protein [Candidatus Saccharibacteria bacterium]MCY4088695.1 hypothetical protein [Candidatus Saccharibacteria bacterium]